MLGEVLGKIELAQIAQHTSAGLIGKRKYVTVYRGFVHNTTGRCPNEPRGEQEENKRRTRGKLPELTLVCD